MAELLCGLETEYAFAVVTPGGERYDRAEAVEKLISIAQRRLKQLPDAYGRGMFLQNGARFYIDCGLHPEMTTPECPNPWDAVRYTLAGERILSEIAREFAATTNAAEVIVLRCNVDYSGQHTTWGCHESYLHRCNPELIREQIIPHLVSRLIYAGAGGFQPFSRGIEFTVSPRVAHLVAEVSGTSTDARGIYHTKDESLSSEGYHRLHLLCGESLCSQIAQFVKVGATALVVAMIEGGVRPGDTVTLSDPLAAMRRFANDTECKAEAPAADGRPLTALAIQRHYLALAEANEGASFMPPWAPQVCQHWRLVLDQLEHDLPSANRLLDWPLKLGLYRDHVARRGLDWESFSTLNRTLNSAAEPAPRRRRRLLEELAVPPGARPDAESASDLTAPPAPSGLDPNRLRQFLNLRHELFEIDTRFGQLGDKSIFGALDRAGLLAHHVAGVDNIEHATENPPASGRARLRGESIKRLGGRDRPYFCDWTWIHDLRASRFLDLSDPWQTEERWREASPESPVEVLI